MTRLEVADPSGKIHAKKIGARNYTHALIRQNKDSEPGHYYVNWATSKANAEREARVLRECRSYIEIVEL